jgi:PKD repeat protein
MVQFGHGRGNSSGTLGINNITINKKATPSLVGTINNTSSINLTVNTKPNVGFTVNNPKQCVNNGFIFTDTSIVSSAILSRLWDFGDGTTSGSIISNKSYTTAKTFNVKLVSIANTGCRDSITKTGQNLPVPYLLAFYIQAQNVLLAIILILLIGPQ